MWKHFHVHGMRVRGWHGHHAHGLGFCCSDHEPGMGYRSRREIIRGLEEYQKDLEQEIADVADRISELKREGSED